MPLYTYKCVECNINQEVDHPMMDSPEVLCSKCGKACKKIPGVGAVKFNGTGWGSGR
jgi:putative FmdB family regulatory protein